MALFPPSDYQRFRRYYQHLGPFLTNQKNKESTAAIFSLLAVSLFGWYAVRPTIQTILFLRREIADKTTVNQKMEEKITSLIEAQAAYEQQTERISLVRQAVPTSPEAVELATQIKNLAQELSASVSAIQVTTVAIDKDATPSGQSKESAGTFSITAILSGNWGAIRSFLGEVVNLRRVTSIDSITLKPDRGAAGTTGAPIINLVAKLTSYYGK